MEWSRGLSTHLEWAVGKKFANGLEIGADPSPWSVLNSSFTEYVMGFPATRRLEPLFDFDVAHL